MRITLEGLSLIKNEENLRLTAYTCPAGILTIGYGHTGDDVYDGETITPEDAECILRRDVNRFETCVSNVCAEASSEQFSAMVSLAFNIGERAFRKSSVARLHNRRAYSEAGQAFALWNKAGREVLPGLVRRRAAEAALYLKNSEQCETPAARASGEKPLNRSRVVNGHVAALAGTAGTVGLSELHETTSAEDWSHIFVQFLPYVSEIKWLLISVVILGIGYGVYARLHDRYTGRS